MIAFVALMYAVNGRITAPSVSMFTPGIAPNSIPPSSPPMKIASVAGSVKRWIVLWMKSQTIADLYRYASSSQLLMS
jgi:hypothetical protein